MTEQDVRAALCKVLNSEKPKHWPADYRFLGDAVDSLDHAAFVLALQEDYGVKFGDDVLDELDSITHVVACAGKLGVPQ